MLDNNFRDQVKRLKAEISNSQRVYLRSKGENQNLEQPAICFVEMYIKAFIEKQKHIASRKQLSKFYISDYVFKLLKTESQYASSLLLGYSLKLANYIQTDISINFDKQVGFSKLGLKGQLIYFFLAESVIKELSYLYGDTFHSRVNNFKREHETKLNICCSEMTGVIEITDDDILYLETILNNKIDLSLAKKFNYKNKRVYPGKTELEKICQAVDVCYGKTDYSMHFYDGQKTSFKYDMMLIVDMLCRSSILKSRRLLGAYKQEVDFTNKVEKTLYVYCLVRFIDDVSDIYGDLYYSSIASCYDNLYEENSMLSKVCNFPEKA